MSILTRLGTVAILALPTALACMGVQQAEDVFDAFVPDESRPDTRQTDPGKVPLDDGCPSDLDVMCDTDDSCLPDLKWEDTDDIRDLQGIDPGTAQDDAPSTTTDFGCIDQDQGPPTEDIPSPPDDFGCIEDAGSETDQMDVPDAPATDPGPDVTDEGPDLLDIPDTIQMDPGTGPSDTGSDPGTPDIMNLDIPNDIPQETVGDTLADAGGVEIPDPDATDTDVVQDGGMETADEVHEDPTCPDDMVLVEWGSDRTSCIDRYEASRSDATSTNQGTSTIATSRVGVIPWNPATLASARTACQDAGKRLCLPDEWFDACRGPDRTTYSYGNSYTADACNGIDAFCYCTAPACAGVAQCPYPHCRIRASPAGDGGPCGAYWHIMPTGSFPDCTNEWGVFDINGNVWELVDYGDSIEHFRGGAYNCGDSEFLHRCDYDATWNPSAKGFRCCKDLE